MRPLLESENDLLTPGRGDFDLANPAVLAAALDGLKPELIINPAAYTAVDRAEDEADLAFRVNAEAPSVIADWTARHHVPLIHFSTDYIFDGSGDTPWREDAPTGPLSVYGASKLAGEQAIAEAGCPHLIVRTSWVYAAKGTNFLRTIARLAGERKELRIVADQIGAPTTAQCDCAAVVAMLPRSDDDLRKTISRSERRRQSGLRGRDQLARFCDRDRCRLAIEGRQIRREGNRSNPFRRISGQGEAALQFSP